MALVGKAVPRLAVGVKGLKVQRQGSQVLWQQLKPFWADEFTALNAPASPAFRQRAQVRSEEQRDACGVGLWDSPSDFPAPD
jgi:hypothetical protein